MQQIEIFSIDSNEQKIAFHTNSCVLGPAYEHFIESERKVTSTRSIKIQKHLIIVYRKFKQRYTTKTSFEFLK